jgi:hypothetical protein
MPPSALPSDSALQMCRAGRMMPILVVKCISEAANVTEFGKILLAQDDPRDLEPTLRSLRGHILALDYSHRRGAFATGREGHPAGREVARARKSAPGTRINPVIVVTSTLESRAIEECYRLSVNAYLARSAQIGDLIDEVRQIGAFWSSLNEPPPGSLGRRR